MGQKKPSIHFINGVYPPAQGESGRLLRDLARAFSQAGWQVTITATIPSKNVKVPLIKNATLNLISSPKMKKPYGYRSKRLQDAARSMPSHDIIVTMSAPATLIQFGRKLASKHGSAHFHWVQTHYPEAFQTPPGKWEQFFLNYNLQRNHKALKQCDKIVVPGRCMARRLTQLGVAPSNISVIPNWYNPEQLRPLKKHSKRTKKPSFIDDTPKFRLLYAGSLSSLHQIEPLIKAARYFENKIKDIEFIFAGCDKEVEPYLPKPVPTNIRLLPRQPENHLGALMHMGDVHVVSLKTTANGLTLPNKFYAAIAAERPCLFIGPKTSEIGRIVQEFNAGIIVSGASTRALVKAIEELRYDEDKWTQYYKGMRKAKKIYQPKSSWDAFITRAKALIH